MAVGSNILNKECLGVIQLPEITCKSNQVKVKLKDKSKPLLTTSKIDNVSKTCCRRNRWRNKNIVNLLTWWLHQKSLPFPHVLSFLFGQDKVWGCNFSHFLGQRYPLETASLPRYSKVSRIVSNQLVVDCSRINRRKGLFVFFLKKIKNCKETEQHLGRH